MRARDGCEFLLGPVVLITLGEDVAQDLGELDEKLHVQGGVGQPFAGERAGGPVRVPVTFFQLHTEELFHHRAEIRMAETGHASRELGIE